jgi:hypothetical protein
MTLCSVHRHGSSEQWTKSALVLKALSSDRLHCFSRGLKCEEINFAPSLLRRVFSYRNSLHPCFSYNLEPRFVLVKRQVAAVRGDLILKVFGTPVTR